MGKQFMPIQKKKVKQISQTDSMVSKKKNREKRMMAGDLMGKNEN